jgi:hypothetical protein
MGSNAVRIFLDEDGWNFECLRLIQDCLICNQMITVHRGISRIQDRIKV